MKAKTIVIAGLVAVAAMATLYAPRAVALVTDAYPADRLQATALDRCTAGNPDFLRFSEHQRGECFAQAHLSDTAER